jgi:hypothetical protein
MSKHIIEGHEIDVAENEDLIGVLGNPITVTSGADDELAAAGESPREMLERLRSEADERRADT